MSEGSSEAIFWEGPLQGTRAVLPSALHRASLLQGCGAVQPLAGPPISASEAPRVTFMSGVIRCHALSELAKVRVMAKGKVSSPPEQEAEEECLHCAIVALVEARIAAGGADAANLAALTSSCVCLRRNRPNSWRTHCPPWATCFFKRAVWSAKAQDRRTSGRRSAPYLEGVLGVNKEALGRDWAASA